MSLLIGGFAAATAVACGGILLIWPLALAAILAAASAWASHRLIARIDRLAVLAAIEAPVPRESVPLTGDFAWHGIK
jgi:hypothetical protein